jgi:hypothetical protein
MTEAIDLEQNGKMNGMNGHAMVMDDIGMKAFTTSQDMSSM